MKKKIYGTIAFASFIATLGFVGNTEVGYGSDTVNFIGAFASILLCLLACKVGKIGGWDDAR